MDYRHTCTGRYLKWFLLAGLLLSHYLAQHVPYRWAWENGPFEWTQVSIMLVSLVLCSNRARVASRAGDVLSARIWMWTLPVWLVMIGRELSWGRVFFITGYKRSGPEFVKMSEIPIGGLIHAVVIAIVLSWIIAVFYYGFHRVVFRLIRERRFPIIESAITIAAFTYALVGGRFMQMPVTEEIVEMLAYLSLLNAVLCVDIFLDQKSEARSSHNGAHDGSPQEKIIQQQGG